MKNKNWRENTMKTVRSGCLVKLRGETILRVDMVDGIEGLALLYHPTTDKGPDGDSNGWEKLSDLEVYNG